MNAYGNMKKAEKTLKIEPKKKKRKKTQEQMFHTGKLTKRQEDLLKEHAKHHTPSHMRMMRKLMKEGDGFTKAHNKANKKYPQPKPKNKKK